MFYDKALGHDRLYVTDVTNQAIMVWDSISTLPTGTPTQPNDSIGICPLRHRGGHAERSSMWEIRPSKESKSTINLPPFQQ